MAEIGGPTIAEMQPKPAGVVEKVKGQLRKLFTPEGRAEAMADKQIKTILESVAPEDRIKAMEMLEAKRPDLVASHLPGAKDRLVKEAVVGAAALGTLLVGGTVAYVKRESIGGFVRENALKAYKKIPEGGKDVLAKARIEADILQHRVKTATSGVTDRVNGAMNWIKNRLHPAKVVVGGTPPELVDAFLSQAIKLPELDAVDKAQKITSEFLRKALNPGLFKSSELNNMQGEHLASLFLEKARDAGRWVPLVTAKGREPWGFGDDHEGIGGLMTRGLVTMKELSNGLRLFMPTEKFVEFVGRNVAKNDALSPKV